MASGEEKTAPPPRPTIALPPRNPFGYFGGTSPGPMTLVSSFFADDPDNDCPSFRQLLAGAMASPRQAEAEAGDGRLGVRQSTPVGMLVVPSPVFTVPAGISPAGLLESPVLFSPGHFGMSHQQALAQVTAQAAWSNSYKNAQAEFANVSTTKEPSVEHPEVSRGNTGEQIAGKTSDNASLKLELAAGLQVEHKSQPALNVEKPADDGYNWRKYGQKQVKGSAYPRSYYRCTYPKCSVTKKVERSVDGQVTEIIYKGQHNHQRPPGRRAKEGGMLSKESNGGPDLTRSLDGQPGNPVKLNEIRMNEHESDQVTTGHLSVESYGEDVGDAEVGTENREDDEPDLKKRNIDNGVVNSVASHKTVAEQKIILQTRSEVNLLDDGYRWRKYGQKVVKGNHHPRSYYRCTYAGCNVRKHVERASADPGAVITTYEGKHDHDVPAARNSSHNTASVDSFVNATQNAASNTK